LYSKLIEADFRKDVLPKNLRVTILDKGGRVVYDNDIDSLKRTENHFDRPEIKNATCDGKGWSIRRSSTLNKMLLYYARKVDNGFIRVALPYDSEAKTMLKPDKTFMLFVSVLFAISLILLWLIAKRFGYDIERLKDHITAQQNAKAALKTEMTSAIAHELRTPVSSIRGYTETLADPEIPADKKEAFIERTHVAAIRLSELLSDISLLTKIEEHEGGFQDEEVNITDVVNKIIEEFEKQIAANSVKISVKIPDKTFIQGNYTLIYSIFRNLTENTLKYAGKWITLEYNLTGNDNERLYFSVSDSGSGVKEKDLPRIFERFYRGEKSGRSREDGGSGLGLAIVRHAVMR
ncbi:MAG: ATP-binding protein, partial [Bacteroidales bacterium]